MSAKKRKALERQLLQFEKHLGHRITFIAGGTRGTEMREGRLQRVVLDSDLDGCLKLWLEVPDSKFPVWIYADSARACSCGEGGTP